MKFTTILAGAAFTVSALAAPAAETVSQMAATSQWTITNMKRTCANGTCTWDFGILANGKNTPCTFKVKGSPAYKTDSVGNVCGTYTVSTGWSDQFGEENAFTTLAVVNNALNPKQIVYPAYTDKVLGLAGKVVKPDQSYAPANVPQ